MPAVRIIATPAGEAPLQVREQWVGLTLPLKDKFKKQPSDSPEFGVLSAPKSVLGLIAALIFKRPPMRSSYIVDTIKAIEILGEKSPHAADWWRKNTPHLLQPKRSFAFQAEVCELVDDLM